MTARLRPMRADGPALAASASKAQSSPMPRRGYDDVTGAGSAAATRVSGEADAPPAKNRRDRDRSPGWVVMALAAWAGARPWFAGRDAQRAMPSGAGRVAGGPVKLARQRVRGPQVRGGEREERRGGPVQLGCQPRAQFDADFGQDDSLDAPVVCVDPSFDQAPSLEPVDKPRGRRRVVVPGTGQLRRRRALPGLEPEQGLQLPRGGPGSGDAPHAGLVLGKHRLVQRPPGRAGVVDRGNHASIVGRRVAGAVRRFNYSVFLGQGPVMTDSPGPSRPPAPPGLLPERLLGYMSVSALGFGCMALSGSYGPADPDASLRAINTAIDNGVTMLDTADFYGAGENERLVRQALANRPGVVAATKTGVRRGPNGMAVDGTPEHLRAACEQSLSRLGVERIGLFTLARLDPAVPVEESVGAMADLVAEGLVERIGLSEVSAATLRRACAAAPITALQSEYSLWERGVEAEILPACGELRVGFVAYSPLGRGFLTGAVDSHEGLADSGQRRNHPRFAPDNVRRNTALLTPIAGVAAELGATPAQVALAWLLARAPFVVPIPGSRSAAHVESNMRAVDVTLSSGQVARLDAALPVGGTAGTRYPAAVMATLEA